MASLEEDRVDNSDKNNIDSEMRYQDHTTSLYGQEESTEQQLMFGSDDQTVIIASAEGVGQDQDEPEDQAVGTVPDQEEHTEQELMSGSDDQSMSIVSAEDVGHDQEESPSGTNEQVGRLAGGVAEAEHEDGGEVEHYADGLPEENTDPGDVDDGGGASLELERSDLSGWGEDATEGNMDDSSDAEVKDNEDSSEDAEKHLCELARVGDADRLRKHLESMNEEQFEEAYPTREIEDQYADDSPLHEAVAAPSLDCVKLLVERIKNHEQGRDIDSHTSRIEAKNHNFESALMLAVKSTDKESKTIFQYLIDQEAKADVYENKYFRNLLHIACIYENEEAAKILLREKKDTGDFNMLLDPDKKGNNPVHLAITYNKINMARLMIEAVKSLEELYGFDWWYVEREEQEDEDNASADDNIDVDPVHASVEIRTNDNYVDDDATAAATNDDDDDDDDDVESFERSAYPNLHLACMLGRLEIVDMIFKAEETLSTVKGKSELVNRIDCESKTPLFWALENKHFPIVERCIEEGADVTKLLSVKNKTKTSPLHLVASTGDEKTVALLYEKGAAINEGNVHDETPLYVAAAQDNLGVCRELINRGADPEKKTTIGFTPLLVAANAGHAGTVKTLLDMPDERSARRTNIFAKTNDGRSALHLAALGENVETLKVLLKHVTKTNPHALMDLLDEKGNTPVHYVAEYGNRKALECLRKYNVDTITQNLEGMTALHLASKNGMTSVVEDLVESKTLVNFRNFEGNTALHLAAAAGEDQVIRILVKQGKAKLEERNDPGMRPLHMAAKENFPTTCELLLDLGAEVDAKGEHGATALQLACEEGSAHVVPLLIEKGADVKSRNYFGDSCLDVAIEKNHTEVAFALVRSRRWKDALKEATWDDGVKRWDTPMRKLIRKMPDVAKVVLEKCSKRTQKIKEKPKKKHDSTKEKKKKEAKNIQRSVKQPNEKAKSDDDHPNESSDEEYSSKLNENEEEFKFNYEFIEDTEWKKEEIKKKEKQREKKCEAVGVQYNELKESNKSVKENHCLRVMIRYKREDLLSLPLVRSLLRRKWTEFGLTFFCVNLFFYSLFLFFLTTYMLSTAFMAPFQYKGLPAINEYSGTSCEKIRQYTAVVGPAAVLPTFAVVSKYFVLILSTIQILKELLQVPSSGLSYFTNIENLLEWFIYVTAILLVVDIEPCHRETGIRLDWQWQVGAVCVFWSWINLLLFIRKLPIFGIYVVIFTTILRSFMLFLPILMLFVVAFAISFYCLLANQVPFRFEVISMFKVFVMMIGEMDYGNVFDDRVGDNDVGVQIWYEVVTYIQFALFLIIMAILIMNLLVGLAVDDIKRLTDESQLQTLAMQTEFLLDVEQVAHRFSAHCRKTITKTDNNFNNHDNGNKNQCSSPSCSCIRRNQVHDIHDHNASESDRDITKHDIDKSEDEKEKKEDIKKDQILPDGRHKVRLQSHRGTMARLARNWVLSETAIIEESYKTEKSDQEKTADEMKKLTEQVEHLTEELRNVKEMKNEITQMSKILENMAKR